MSKDIKEEIFEFISTHEAQISYEMKERDEDINVRFTTYGNKAGCRAILDVLNELDDETQKKVLEMMRNKKVMV